MRWIVSPLVSSTFALPLQSLIPPDTQAEMNRYWEGTSFTLADRYTEISKILFISLFYSFLVPIGLFVSTLACLVLFAVDRYLLFRKTKPPPMLDATMASSVPFSDLLFPHGFRIPSVAELSHLCGGCSYVCHHSNYLQVLLHTLPLFTLSLAGHSIRQVGLTLKIHLSKLIKKLIT